MLSMRIARVVGLTLVIATAGCAIKPVQAKYPTPPGSRGDTGTLAVVFSQPARNVVMTVNGNLVVTRAHTNRITVTGVETGYCQIAIAAGALESHERAWIDAGHVTTVPIASAGDQTSSSGAMNAVISVFAFLVTKAISSVVF